MWKKRDKTRGKKKKECTQLYVYGNTRWFIIIIFIIIMYRGGVSLSLACDVFLMQVTITDTVR